MQSESQVHRATPMDAAAASPAEAPDRHIVDVLIEERARPFSRMLLRTPFLGEWMFRLLKYYQARTLADEIALMSGTQAFDLLANDLNLQLTVDGLNNLPRTGPVIVIANHPTGLADGIALWQTLRPIRKDIVYFANADALRVAPAFEDILIPIEWRLGERTPSKSRTALVRAKAELKRGKCLVIFPSGIPAVPTPVLIDEQPWLPTFVSLASKAEAPVVPVAIKAGNSWLFYVFCILNRPLRHMSLFREFINKRGKRFVLKVLPANQFQTRSIDVKAAAAALRMQVRGEAQAL